MNGATTKRGRHDVEQRSSNKHDIMIIFRHIKYIPMTCAIISEKHQIILTAIKKIVFYDINRNINSRVSQKGQK